MDACRPQHLPPRWAVEHEAVREFGEFSVYRSGGRQQEGQAQEQQEGQAQEQLEEARPGDGLLPGEQGGAAGGDAGAAGEAWPARQPLPTDDELLSAMCAP